MRAARSSSVSNTTARPSCSISSGVGGRLLDDRAAGREVAAQHRDAALADRSGLSNGRTTSCAIGAGGALDLLAERAAGDRQRVEVQQRPSSRSIGAMPPARWKSSM